MMLLVMFPLTCTVAHDAQKQDRVDDEPGEGKDSCYLRCGSAPKTEHCAHGDVNSCVIKRASLQIVALLGLFVGHRERRLPKLKLKVIIIERVLEN